ncbi:TetR/AcrR family transcriptional regulator [Aliikangiella marina]|uniref:TetR/AcrR family transcriptional regulator n=1 Tax=Aliikangiella marina TaxID=1712262 RepID=UPI00163D47BE|nr:TetR/AcrR family transcriptional regulator [Aliikangiella marina]
MKKIVDAIMKLVEDKYFEQISIIDITTEAQLSTGAFYRRFKSKEAALPVIYEQFQIQLRDWLTEKSKEWQKMELSELVYDMTEGIFRFVDSKKGVFRTIYLNARLHSDLLQPQTLEQRINDFKFLASFYTRFIPEQTPHYEESVRFAIFTLVNNAIEKCVYPEITPASGCPQNFEESITATSEMLAAYLTNKLAQ